MSDVPLLPRQARIPSITAVGELTGHRGVVATREHAVIRHWAEQRQAEPATGEATASGPATVDVHDGGAGVRFNFPGVGRFRPIAWEEWFGNFDQHQLVFVFEDAATASGHASSRFRIVKGEDWQAQLDSALLPDS